MRLLLPVFRLGLALCVLTLAGACKSDPPLPTPGSVDADKFLFDRGTKELQEKKWQSSRLYFRRLVDTYPQSPYRADAKLGVGDSYLGENRIESNILGANEFREFLTFFPLHPKADYAQYRLAIAYVRQILGPQRDQTATKDALRELDRFLKAHPNSPLKPEVEKVRRETRDRLSESEFKVGLFNYRYRMYAGAISRLSTLLTEDPEYTYRDGAYYYLAESLLKVKLTAEALVYYEKLIAEFKTSEYLERAQRRVAELKR